MEWLNAIAQGILIGGLYALFAAGLSLIFGIMRMVNIAHGDLIVLSAYVVFVVVATTGLHPLLAILIAAPIMAVIGYGLQRLIFNRTLGGDILPPLLVSFGLSIMLQNGLLIAFSADSRKLDAGGIETESWSVLQGLTLGWLPLLMFVSAVIVIGSLQFLFYRTPLGRALRATSDDPEIARAMGYDNRHLFGLAMALSMGVVAIAGAFLAIRANFTPTEGPARLIFGFESVIMGGLGNLWGTLIGGVILGVAQSLGAVLNPGWQILAGHLAFLLVLAIRPQGLLSMARR
jgi:branched-chain amino acid transport system permease protein